MSTYILTLPIGKITLGPNGKFNGQVFNSGDLKNAWSPSNPNTNGGWQQGDKLIVVCGFHTAEIINPETNQPYPTQPTPADFYGLSVAALYNPTKQDIRNAENQLARNQAGTVGTGITENSAPSASDLFFNAKSSKEDVWLQPTSRGELKDIVFMWTMDFNSGYVPRNGSEFDTDKVDLIFGYGDPNVGDDWT